MWQVALGAALAAGSGFLAKTLFNLNAPIPISDSNQNHPKSDQDSIFSSEVGKKEESLGEESIFRFSSSPGSNNLRKKIGCEFRRNKGNFEGLKRNFDGRLVKKCGSGKKLYVCLKKRRITKTAPGKCDSCSSKGNSVFGWGLGIGMMCMMSARRAEINKLNVAMEETSKVVLELKDELSQQKKPHNLHASKSEDIKEEHMEPAFVKLCTENRKDKRIFSFPVTEEGEYASSVLTDELQMDQLEEELKSELQKLHGCSEDGSGFENGVLADEDLNAYESNNGVLPYELNQKLSQVLIEQQESQIVELESELQRSHRKLHDKETELQALKECVRRLTEFSLANASDEDTEGQVEQQSRIIIDNVEMQIMGNELRKSMAGNKRTSMEF